MWKAEEIAQSASPTGRIGTVQLTGKSISGPSWHRRLNRRQWRNPRNKLAELDKTAILIIKIKIKKYGQLS